MITYVNGLERSIHLGSNDRIIYAVVDRKKGLAVSLLHNRQDTSIATHVASPRGSMCDFFSHCRWSVRQASPDVRRALLDGNPGEGAIFGLLEIELGLLEVR